MWDVITLPFHEDGRNNSALAPRACYPPSLMEIVTMSKHSQYLHKALSDTKGIIRRARITLADIKYDAIVCTGVSGLLLGPTLAYLLRKRLAIIRKPVEMENNNCHGDYIIESSMNTGDTWIFIDDLISSGRTATRVVKAMNKEGWPKGVGAYLYNEDHWRRGKYC